MNGGSGAVGEEAMTHFWSDPDPRGHVAQVLRASAPKDAQPFFQAAQGVAAPYIKAGKWHTFSDSDQM